MSSAVASGPGGYYTAYRDSMPDQVEVTGDDALCAHITFESGAIAHWIDDHGQQGECIRTGAPIASAERVAALNSHSLPNLV